MRSDRIPTSFSPIAAISASANELSGARATFSTDAVTSSEAKDRGKDTVMDVKEFRLAAAADKGSEVGTARRRADTDGRGVGTACRVAGGENRAVLARRRRTKPERRGDIRRIVAEVDWPADELTTAHTDSMHH